MNRIFNITISLLLFLFSSTAYAATITAQLNVSPVLISESFQLTYTAEGSVDNEPNFTPIQKNFEILNTQTSNNISMINGDFKRTKKWILSLTAKNTGNFIIPAIKFGKDLAPEVEINVEKSPLSSAANPLQDFLIELEASKKVALLQEQIIITARLLVAKSISSYQFSDLRIDDTDTIIKPIGKDRQYKTYRGSKAFIIVERQFAIFPQHKGSLKIQPFVAEVHVPANNARGNFFDPFNNYTTQKRIQSNTLNIKIRAIPATFTASNWLPSPSVTVIEDWPHAPNFTAGEPITRTITIMADALTSAQLPELDNVTIAGLKQYPDKPVLEDKIGGQGISSIRKVKVAFIPTKAGSYTLPSIEIPWWNTKTNKIDIARLPKREFNVQASSVTEQLNIAPTSTVDSATGNAKQQSDIPNRATSAPFWPWLSLLLLSLWIITLYYLVKSKRLHKTKRENSNHTSQTLHTSLKYLKMSCAKNNSQDTKTNLLKWANVIFPDKAPQNLSDLAVLLPENMATNVLELNTALYSSKDKTWRCGELYNLCRLYQQENKTTQQKQNSAELESFNAPTS